MLYVFQIERVTAIKVSKNKAKFFSINNEIMNVILFVNILTFNKFQKNFTCNGVQNYL